MSDFYARGGNKRGVHSQCKPCHIRLNKEAMRRRRADGREHGALIQRKYGISTEDWQKMHDQQHGACAVCGRSCRFNPGGRLSVDHDHETGKVRGLLCRHCNVAIGYMDDSSELLRRAADYLEKHA